MKSIHTIFYRIIIAMLMVVLFCTNDNSLKAQSLANRIGNSPYPVTQRPDTLFLINIGGFTRDQQLSTVTLQGLLAITKPRIMVQSGNPNFIADLTNYGVVYDSTYLNDFNGLFGHFAGSVSGYLLCNLNDSSTNIAISSCRFLNAIAATAADTASLNAAGLSLVYNMLGKSQQWVFDTFQPVLSKRIISYQDTVKFYDLSDYSVFAGALQYWDATFTNFSDTIYNNLVPGTSVMMGWGPDEHSSVLQCSQHGVMVHASDWASNLSTYTNFDVPLSQKNESSDTDIIPNTHTVCFVMTDGDNIQWLTNNFATSTNWYASPNRGKCNIGWTVSPALAELAPTMMKYLYDSAASTPQGTDYFIAGASGLGYYYPDAFKNLNSAAGLTARMMQKADLHILNIIGDNYNGAYFEPYLNQPNIDAIFYYDYSNYDSLEGLTSCISNKPVITPRFDLWGSFFTPWLISQAINNQASNPNSPDGYSLVDVNVWSMTVDSILSTIAALNSNVRVVSPDAFVKLFKKGTMCQAEQTGINNTAENAVKLNCYPNPASNSVKVEIELPGEANAELSLYDICGQKLQPLLSGQMTPGQHIFYLDIAGLSNGIYFLGLKGPSFSVTQKMVVSN